MFWKIGQEKVFIESTLMEASVPASNPQGTFGVEGQTARGASFKGAPSGPATQSPVAPVADKLMPAKTTQGLSVEQQQEGGIGLFDSMIATINYVDANAKQNKEAALQQLTKQFVAISKSWNVDEIVSKVTDAEEKLALIYMLGQYVAIYQAQGKQSAIQGVQKLTSQLLSKIKLDEVGEVSLTTIVTQKDGFALKNAKDIINYINSAKATTAQATQKQAPTQQSSAISQEYMNAVDVNKVKTSYATYIQQNKDFEQNYQAFSGIIKGTGIDVLQKEFNDIKLFPGSTISTWYQAIYLPNVRKAFVTKVMSENDVRQKIQETAIVDAPSVSALVNFMFDALLIGRNLESAVRYGVAKGMTKFNNFVPSFLSNLGKSGFKEIQGDSKEIKFFNLIIFVANKVNAMVPDMNARKQYFTSLQGELKTSEPSQPQPQQQSKNIDFKQFANAFQLRK